MGKTKYEIDFTQGRIFPKIIAFALPIIFSGFMQTLFNVVDMMVVGRFVGNEALAAVGSTSSLINLLVQLFLGISMGVTIVASQAYGAKDEARMHKAAHTAIAISLFGGIFLAISGVCLARTLLELMGSPDDVIDMATTYVRLYFAGIPLILLYNFTSAIMRAYGDNKRPLYFLTVSGVLNIVLNLFFVLVLHMDVAGVAIATFASQGVAAILNLFCLMHIENACRIDVKKVRFHKKELLEILRFGIPTGIQSSVFAVSNVLLQSAINSFGSVTMAAHGAVNYMGNILGNVSNGFGNAASTACAQNFGAREKGRIQKSWLSCLGCVAPIQIVLGLLGAWIMPLFMQIFTTEPKTIEVGTYIAWFYIPFWFIGGMMNVSSSSLRGIGYSTVPMIVSICGTCVLRVIWIFTVFAAFPQLGVLYSVYPLTWGFTALVQNILFWYFFRKLKFDAEAK